MSDTARSDALNGQKTPVAPDGADATAVSGDVEKTMARDAAIVSGATLVSRLLGFVRDCTIAAVLGAGPLSDAFFIALRLPNLMRRLFGEGSLSLALVSEFSHTRQQDGLPRAYALVRACLVWLILILGAVCAAAYVWAVPLTAALAPGFLDTPELFARTVEFVRLCFPYALLICITALCSGVLQAQGSFLAPALAPSVLNLTLLGGALLAWLAGWAVPETLCISLLVAGVLQIALQQPFLARRGFTWRGDCSLGDPRALRVGRQMVPAVFGAAVYQVSIVITTMLASLLPEGSISQLYYADRLVQFPLGVFGIAVGTAALPALALLAAKGADDEFRGTLNASLRLTLFISLPAAAGLAGMADPIVQTLFGRGAFSAADVSGTVHALWGYAPGLPAFAAARPLLAAFHARRDARTPVVAAVAGLFMTVVSGVGLMESLGHAGLALAVSLGSWVNVAGLFVLLRRREGAFVSGAGCIWGYAAMSVGVWAAARVCVTLLGGAWSLVCIPVIIASYCLVAMLLQSPDIRLFMKRGQLRQ